MSVLGDTSIWQAKLVRVQDILRDVLLPVAWPLCDNECAGASLHENVVTDRLVKHLVAVKTKKRIEFEHVPFEIHPQVGRNPDGDQPGRSDILVSPCLGNEEFNLIYECKWLEKRSGCASAYIGNDGVGRFVCGKYSSQVNVGNMVGYVYKATPRVGAEHVIAEMKKKGMPIPIPSRNSKPDMYVMRSSHDRQKGLGPIEITHILLPYA